MVWAGQCNKTSTPYSIFIVIPSLEGWPTKAKEVPSPHEVRLTALDTNTVFQCFWEKGTVMANIYLNIISLLFENLHGIYFWIYLHLLLPLKM